jgi:hypothetical protein
MKVQRTKKGDLIVKNKYDFNCAVIGTLLGDGSLNRFRLKNGPDNKTKKGPLWNRTELRIFHKEGFKEYLDWKITLMRAYIENVSIYEKTKEMNGKVFKGFDAHIKHRKNFHYMYRNFYVGGKPSTNNRISGAKKVVKQKILNRLSPLSIAIWYMDDGSLYEYRRGDKVYRTISLHTDCFTFNACKLIKEYFENKYNIHFNVNHNGMTDKSKDYGYKLRCNRKKDIELFIDIVKEFVEDVKCMHYKLPNSALHPTL